MTTTTRFVTHGIALDPLAKRDLDVMHCKTCPEDSGTVEKLDLARTWAMRHTGQTGHTEFRLSTENSYLVKRLEGGLPSLT